MPPPLARTVAEAHLYMDFKPCEACGERGFSGRGGMVLVDGELCSRYAGGCRRCRLPREFTFRVPREVRLDLTLGQEVTFGGTEPSELLDPGQWLLVADLTARGAQDDSDLMAAAAAVDEVLKFIPAGAESVPQEMIRSQDGLQMYASDPGRFDRRRLDVVAATYREHAAKLREATD